MRNVFYILFAILTILAALFAVAGLATGYIHPGGREWISFFGLILLPVLVVNLILFLGWCLAESHWNWIPLAILILNSSFILSMFQIRMSKQAPPQNALTIKLITYNVDNFNTDSKNKLPDISEWLKRENPDIVCLQECPLMPPLSLEKVAKAIPFLPHYCSTRDAYKGAGLAIFSKYPIIRYQPFLYPDSQNKSLLAVLSINGDSVRVFNNHLQTTSVNAVKPRLYQARAKGNSQEGTEAAFQMAFKMKQNFVLRANQADEVGHIIHSGTTPTLVCGDFNDTPASYAYHRIKGELTDGFRECGTGFGYTFRQLKRIFRIDYIFYSLDFKGIQYDSPNLPFSDHNPVVWSGFNTRL